MKEMIKDIKGYEGRYQITNKGRVFSYPNSSRKGYRELKQDRSKRKNTTYRRITLCVNGKTKRFQVHQLVGLHFIPNPNNKPFMNHLDNDGENNWETNLEWCTQKENMQHSVKQGRQEGIGSIGGTANAIIIKKQVLKKLTVILGDRLLANEVRQRTSTTSRFITYRCKYCGNKYTRRSDAPAILRGGVCTDCFRKRRKSEL